MAFTFDQILAVDPNNTSTVAANAAITIFNPADPGKAPITLTDVNGTALPNPITVNRNGYGPAFQHPTLDRVGWHGGGFTGYFTSYEGIKNEAVSARTAAQAAAANAGAAAAAAATGALSAASADAQAAAANAATAASNASASATAAANSAALVNAPADTAIATAISGAASATRAALNSASASVASARPGNRVVFLGDSITKGADAPDIVYRQNSWPVYASITSGQRVHYVYNAGVAGETTTQMLARFDTAVTAKAPNLVTIAGGTNDLAVAGGIATARTNITELVRRVRAIGAVPVLCTLAPGESATPSTRRTDTLRLNAWIRDFAAKNGLSVLDFYGVLTDPANGNFLGAYSSGDGIHPNAAGYAAMGKHAASILAPLLPDWKPLLPQDNTDPNNIFTNGLFLTDADANGVPDSWSNQNGITGQTVSLVTGDTTIKGNWVKMVLAASSGTSILFQTKTGAPVVPGHVYAFMGRVKTSALTGGAAAKAFIRWTATANRDDSPIQSLVYDIDSGMFYGEVLAPPGATSVQCQLTSPAGTGTYQFAQVGLYDLTAMGVL